MNSILVLVIVGYFLKTDSEKRKDVFKPLGLIEDIFILSITTNFLPFFLAFFVDPDMIIKCLKRIWIENQI